MTTLKSLAQELGTGVHSLVGVAMGSAAASEHLTNVNLDYDTMVSIREAWHASPKTTDTEQDTISEQVAVAQQDDGPPRDAYPTSER